jgi:hypothetical protein
MGAGGKLVRGALVAMGIAALVGMGAAGSSAASSPWPSPQILSQSSAEIVFTVKVPPYSLDTLSVGGVTYTKIKGPGFAPFAAEGQPNLPVLSFVVAVPAGGAARLVSAERSGETTLEGVRIVPVERAVGPGEGSREGGEDAPRFAEFAYTEEDSIYGAGLIFPSQSVWLTDPGRMRRQDVVRVMVAPFRYEPATGRVFVARQFTVRIGFQGGSRLRGAPPSVDAWEDVYKDALLNYEQGRGWRVAAAPALGAPVMGAPAAENPRFKLTIARTGIYRLAYDSLAAVGFPQGIPMSQVLVWRDTFKDGTPDTIVVREAAIERIDADADGMFSAGDAIEFYARNFYDEFGSRGNEDAFSDKNVYWVSWAPGEHRGIASRSGWWDAVSPARPAHFSDSIHVEQDSLFTNFPPQLNGELTTDLYLWTPLRRITPFDLPGIDLAYPASLTTRFVSFYLNEDYYGRIDCCPFTSTISLFVRGCGGVQTSVGAVAARLPGADVSTFALAPGLLCAEGDRFRFESSLLAADANPGNTLDWFEVAYQRKYEAHGDSLFFSSGGAAGEVEYHVSGFTTADVRVFDLTDPMGAVRIDLTPGEIVSDTTGYSITFQDSISAEHRYVALAASQVLRVTLGALAPRAAPRARDVGADYLIVTHPNFAGDLGDLVAKRQAQGHSVFTATTEEIYDDFGNGMKSDVAIKRFIRQAYFGGNAQFVLLVGDANVDRRGVLINPPPTPPPATRRSDVDYLPTHVIVRLDDHRYNKDLRATDPWFVMVGPAPDYYPDLYLGRLPVGSSAEARGIVTKIINFEDYAGADPWKKKLLAIADDEYKWEMTSSGAGPDCWNPSDPEFAKGCDSVVVIARNLAVVAPDTSRYYLARCTQNDQPASRCGPGCCTVTSQTQTYTRNSCTPQLRALLEQGVMLANYEGHANQGLLTHENLILEDASRKDFQTLTNVGKPFVFFALGCWISDFIRRAEAESFVGDAIGERVILNPNGGACAVLASGCSEYIGTNADFNPFLTRAMFTHLTGHDPQGNLIPARVLLGEVVMTAFVRFAPQAGDLAYLARHVLFGDPAMVIDMGPPAVTVAANDSIIDGSYVFDSATYDTLRVVGEMKDEEAITGISIDLVEGDKTTPVPPGVYTSQALVDTGFARSRAYRVAYGHAPRLGDYVVRLRATDYSGKTSVFDVRVNTGSAAFLRDGIDLPDGGIVTLGQTLSVDLKRAFDFGAGDIAATIDGTPASELGTYTVVNKERPGEDQGKEWEVSMRPSIGGGTHSLAVSVAGFATEREFKYLSARVAFLIDGTALAENGLVAQGDSLEIVVNTEKGTTADSIHVEVDSVANEMRFAADTSGTVWTGYLNLAASGLGLGPHEVAVTLSNVSAARRFRISDEVKIASAFAFPNPFSSDTYFFYDLEGQPSAAKLAIYTLSGRKIFEVNPGEDRIGRQYRYRWDGRDSSGDRVANGTYIYRLTVEAAGATQEFVGRVVKAQ